MCIYIYIYIYIIYTYTCRYTGLKVLLVQGFKVAKKSQPFCSGFWGLKSVIARPLALGRKGTGPTSQEAENGVSVGTLSKVILSQDKL